MNCLPSKLGTCRNTFTSASEVSTTRSSNQPMPATPPTPSISTPDTNTESSTSQPASATVVVSEATTNSTNYAAFSNSCPPSINDAPALPVFNPMSEPNFTWGERDSESFCKELQTTYDELVHWRKKCFKIPWGNAGKSLVDELCRLYTAFADASALECVALRAAVVLPILVLQQPHRRSKPKELIACLERHLKTWKDGDLESLVEEGRAIQQRLPKTRPSQSESNLARSFANLMFNGKTHAALDLLSNNGKGGVLHIDHVLESGADAGLSVKDVLKAKHPVGQSASPADVPPGTPPQPHPIIFDRMDAALIRSIALRTTGAAGPSGLDAHALRRLCTAFKVSSSSLCHSLANVAKRLCTIYVDPKAVYPLLANRLIALDKYCPGVRPIGIGDTARRIIAKAALTVVKDDILDVAGGLQMCAGQIAGCEAAAHSVRESFQESGTEPALLIDATNAFNSLNRMTALHNVRHLCPSFSTILINTYRAHSDLYIDGEVLYSQEGTTQGDPLAMPFYALATVPLLSKLSDAVNQTWYADDAAATGKVSGLRSWWDGRSLAFAPGGMTLRSTAHLSDTMPTPPRLGWWSNPTPLRKLPRSLEIPMLRSLAKASHTLGQPLVATVIPSEFVTDKVKQWTNELKSLSNIATSQPHAAFAAYTHGMMSKWSYISRTIPDISNHLRSLEDTIRSDFIPSITGRPPPNDSVRNLLALPARLGGLGILDPSLRSDDEFNASTKVTAPLINLMEQKGSELTYQVSADQITAKSDVQHERCECIIQAASTLREEVSPALSKAMDLASQPGASSWLTSLPIKEHGFCLHKGAFADAMALRYGWAPTKTPTHCACGATFAVDHILSCPRGGFPSLRHNEIRDLTARLLTEVCNDVQIEPELQEITTEAMSGRSANTTNGARLDVAASGLWGGRRERTLMDVRVFNPFAPSNRNTTLDRCYTKHEREKVRAYGQRVREVEHATFVPLVMSATGGLAKQATNFYKRLASLLADKWEQPYSTTLYWLRCSLSFSLLRSAIQCIRGARSSRGHAMKLSPVDLVTAEASLSRTN